MSKIRKYIPEREKGKTYFIWNILTFITNLGLWIRSFFENLHILNIEGQPTHSKRLH